MEFYYPMPEYKRAASVYSDRYLPGKGDIPHVTAVYDRQRWACIHEDEISDKLVQEKAFGLFANAYLAVASKGAGSFKQYLQNTTAPEKKISRYALRSWKKMEKDMWKRQPLQQRQRLISGLCAKNMRN